MVPRPDAGIFAAGTGDGWFSDPGVVWIGGFKARAERKTMGERYSEKEPLDVWTGQNDRFLNALKKRIRAAKKVDLIVSFIMESGVRELLEELKEVENLRILTGSYLNITQPWALRMLKEECQPSAELNFFDNPVISFHPKSWIFHYEDGIEVIVGSSNLSRSALTDGVEWNCSLKGKDARAFSERFDQLFDHEAIQITDKVLDDYYRQWKKPPVQIPDQRVGKVSPRGVQIESLYALQHARENGVSRGLVQAATGVGKTYLAAFDSEKYERVLFVAHRKEILDQAQASFRRVRPGATQGRIDQNSKDTTEDIIFASVQTLANMVDSGKFHEKDFDYLVIDEFHHAVTDSYKTITEFFKPKFLLGLTATPDRLDGRDVYALCDYNVPYSITLQEAINKGILCPFRYYGIYDDTDYSEVPFSNGRYSVSELDRLYHQAGQRTELILRYFQKYDPVRTLGFCASRNHADMMAQAFNKAGIPAAAVYTGSKTQRDEAIDALNKEQIKIIFSVDMFNEGVDIPDVDMVMMLRPTESPTIFLQQLGRGLRKAPNKPYLTVLDFIGNYRNANRIPEFLTGQTQTGFGATQVSPPLDCIIDFDLRLVDLFREMQKNSQSPERQFLEEYKRIERLKGHRPDRMDLFTEMDGEILDKMTRNPLHNYFTWLHDHGFLTPDEERIYDSSAREIIRTLESTSMSKLYKMPVLMAFEEKDRIRSYADLDRILSSWKTFFNRDENWKDLPGIKTFEEYWQITDRQHLSNIRKNPVNFLEKSSHGLFIQDGNGGLKIGEQYQQYLNDPALAEHWKDILRFRTLEYRRNRLDDRNRH